MRALQWRPLRAIDEGTHASGLKAGVKYRAFFHKVSVEMVREPYETVNEITDPKVWNFPSLHRSRDERLVTPPRSVAKVETSVDPDPSW